MDINLSLIGQMITFSILVLTTMKYIWPPIVEALDKRRKAISDGLAAADRGHELQAQTEKDRVGILQSANEKAADRITRLEKEGQEIVDAARVEAQGKAAQVMEQARQDIANEKTRMVASLEKEVIESALIMAQKILGRELTKTDDQQLIADLLKEGDDA